MAEDQKVKLELPSESRVVPEAVGINMGEIKIHSFHPRISVPVERVHTWHLLWEIFDRPDGIIVSPEGYMLADEYGVPLKKGAKHNSSWGRGELHFGNSSEGVERVQMMADSSFQEELKAKGWIVIPKVQEVTDIALKHELDRKDYKMFSRPVDLPEVIKIIELTRGFDEKPGKYDLVLKDLKELLPYVSGLQLVYTDRQNFRPIHIVRGVARLGDREAIIHLSQLDHLTEPKTGETGDFRDKPNTLARKLTGTWGFDGQYSSQIPHWWTEDNTQRIRQLTYKFAETLDIKHSSFESKDKEGQFRFEVSNRRDSYSDVDLAPDTKKLLETFIRFQDFISNQINQEHQAHNANQDRIYAERARAVGLPDKYS